MLRNTVIAVILLCTAACSLDSDRGIECLNGEGPLVSETRTLTGSFDAVVHQFPGDLNITQGSTPAVVVEGQENLLPFLEVGIVNEVLVIDFSECLETGMFFDVSVTLTDLVAISLEGIGNITFENDVLSDELDLFLTGFGDYELRGAADTLNVNISGQGNVRAFDYTADLCDILIVGNGDVEVTANTSLFVTINGQGNVFYKGNPVVLSDINGSGSVNDAN